MLVIDIKEKMNYNAQILENGCNSDLRMVVNQVEVNKWEIEKDKRISNESKCIQTSNMSSLHLENKLKYKYYTGMEEFSNWIQIV